jgi:hypothetical protein
MCCMRWIHCCCKKKVSMCEKTQYRLPKLSLTNKIQYLLWNDLQVYNLLVCTYSMKYGSTRVLEMEPHVKEKENTVLYNDYIFCNAWGYTITKSEESNHFKIDLRSVSIHFTALGDLYGNLIYCLEKIMLGWPRNFKFLLLAFQVNVFFISINILQL